jgi:hypothetical protein
MGKQVASEAEMLDAIGALVGGAIPILNNSYPDPRVHRDQLEDAYRFAKGLMTPAQWGEPAFVMLAELVDATWPAIHCRKLGLHRTATDAALAVAVERARDFIAINRPTLTG